MWLDRNFQHVIHVTDKIFSVPTLCVAFREFCVKNEVCPGLSGPAVDIIESQMFSVQAVHKAFWNADPHLVLATSNIDL